MAKSKRPTTDNRGAADERAAIKRKVEAMFQQSQCHITVNGGRTVTLIDGGELLRFINSRSKRFRARKGGL